MNNGACDVACFEANSCEHDGQDCNYSPRCSYGCVDYVMLSNGRCEQACNTTACGYDYGDCGVPVPDSFIGCAPNHVAVLVLTGPRSGQMYACRCIIIFVVTLHRMVLCILSVKPVIPFI